MKNGCRLGFLIVPLKQKAYILRQGKPMQEVEDFSGKLAGEDVLPRFELELKIFAD